MTKTILLGPIFLCVTLADVMTIMHDSSSTRPAKELRRYLYLATNQIPEIKSTEELTLEMMQEKGLIIVLGDVSSTLVQSFAQSMASDALLSEADSFPLGTVPNLSTWSERRPHCDLERVAAWPGRGLLDLGGRAGLARCVGGRTGGRPAEPRLESERRL